MIVNNLSVPANATNQEIEKAVFRKVRGLKKISSMEILHESIDARKKPDVLNVLTLRINEPIDNSWRKAPEKCLDTTFPEVTVVGAGPAGLFTALTLLKEGIPVTLLERGEAVEERQATVEAFWNTGVLNPESNVQFGEGGAGTFSDGKLNTLNKTDENLEILRTFVRAGASEAILYEKMPHVGTDVLYECVRFLRNEIINLGGKVRFNTKLTDLKIENGCLSAIQVNDSEWMDCRFLVLAVGHSARDTFSLLKEKRLTLEQKPFAMGVRIEHPQEMITLSQYGTLDYENLGAAPYKLTCKASSGRGVYTFCMCPGGYVVNASSETEKLAINGMSYADRGSKNANAALVVQVSPEDFPSDDPLAGVEFQRMLEKKAYFEGLGKIPVQKLGDFLSGVKTTEFGEITPCMKGAYEFADLNQILPPVLAESLKEAISDFGRKIKGYDRPDALVSCVESRTSSPVRIVRDERGESNICGIYPTGEGAGYAGGIMSSAKDGILQARKIIGTLKGTK